jgi:hypothetical protein
MGGVSVISVCFPSHERSRELSEPGAGAVLEEQDCGHCCCDTTYPVYSLLLEPPYAYLQQEFALWELVDSIDGQHSTTPYIGVPVLQVAQDGGHEGLQNFLLSDAAQETQCDTPDVLVGMLKIVPQVLANQNLEGGRDGQQVF